MGNGWVFPVVFAVVTTSVLDVQAQPAPQPEDPAVRLKKVLEPPRPRPRLRPRPRPRPAGKRVVMLALKNRSAENKDLEQAVKSQLVDIDASLHVELLDALPPTLPARLSLARKAASNGKSEAVAVFWYEHPGPGEHYLFLMDPSAGRLLVRTVQSSKSGGGAEEMAIIVRESVRALLAGGRIGFKAPVAKPKPVKPKPRTRTRTRTGSPGETSLFKRSLAPIRRWLAVEVAYAYEAYATDQPALHGVRAAVAVHAHRNLSVFVGYRFCQRVSFKGDHVTSSLRRNLIEAGVTAHWPFGKFSIGALGAVFFEYVENESEALQDFALATPDRNDMVFGVRPMFYADYRVLPWLRFTAAVGMEIPFNSSRYIEGGVVRNVILDPWPVRPRAEFGLALDLF